MYFHKLTLCNNLYLLLIPSNISLSLYVLFDIIIFWKLFYFIIIFILVWILIYIKNYKWAINDNFAIKLFKCIVVCIGVFSFICIDIIYNILIIYVIHYNWAYMIVLIVHYAIKTLK